MAAAFGRVALASPPVASTRLARFAETILIPALLLLGVAMLSRRLGPDATWDLRNYHIYNAFALFNKAPGVDLLPAQMQSFLPPTQDLPAYWLRLRLDGHPGLLDAILALPTALASVIAFRIGLLLLPDAPPDQRGTLVLLAVLFGLTGASGLPAIGTAISEMTAGCFMLAGVLLLLRLVSGTGGHRQAAWAGGLFGVAVALKLTIAPTVLAASLAFAACVPARLPGRLGSCALLALGVLLGALLVGGPWWLHVYDLTGDPIFPYYNNIFHSPLARPLAMEDGRFWPRGPWQALLYPFYWGFEKNRRVTELNMRDPRMALAYLALVAILVTAVTRRSAPNRVTVCFLLFMTLGFALWEFEFAIFRYLAPLELLGGLLVLLALRPLAITKTLAAAAVLGVFLALFTRYPDWGRASPWTWAAHVVVPGLPAGTMVLVLEDAPLSYVAAYADPAVRFIGVSNNLVHPGDTTGLAQQVEAAVRNHTGPLYGLEYPSRSQTDPVLGYYHLRRDGACQMVQSNLDGSALRLCALTRDDPS